MCGISFLLDRSASDSSPARLARMHAPIRHRGPDGEGFLIVDRDGNVTRSPEARSLRAGIAFRRLNVIDPTARASQPMTSLDGKIAIAFNGEIYNFRALRSRLESEGRAFRTTSDTEVALAAYEAWGTRAFEELDGMWAIVILDLRRNVIVGSRDRFGIKPLYWSVEGDRLYLASEIKQILAARDTRPAPNWPLIASYLRGVRSPILDDTYLDGIRSVPTASWFELPLDAAEPPIPQFRAYWDLASIGSQEIARGEYAAYVEQFEGVLRRAIATHRVADVRLGSLLSGGLDSSTLTALMAEQSREEGSAPAPTFSFGFRDAAPRFCELRYADAVVRRHHLENAETTFDARWVVENAGRVMSAIEEPVLAMPALAQYRVFELCRQHGVTVILDGEGSDEILAGYPYQQRNLLIDRARRGRVFQFAGELHAIARRERRSSAAVLNEYLVAPLRRRAARTFPWIAAVGPRAPEDMAMLRDARSDRGTHASLVNQRLLQDVKWGNVKLVLMMTDKTSMAHSVEARVPFFDLELVRFAFSLPDHFKVGKGERKRILRDVARRYVPPEITERVDRMGFGTPDALMIRDGMWSDVERTITDDALLGAPVFEAGAARRFVDEFRDRTHDDFRAIWRMYALARWSESMAVPLR